MNKTEFIGVVAKKAECSKVDAKKAVDAFIQTVEETLVKGGKISLLGFGSFAVAKKAERKGINPKTKAPLIISARKVVKFKPGAALSKVVK